MRELSVSVDQLTNEIMLLKQQTAMNIIEIGRRLIQAKEQLPHGQWGTWLREKVEFSQATANRFMQVATEFASSSALRNLNPTKVYSLLELPASEREEFLESEHMVASGEVKSVDEMTTRELQQVIKERDEARKVLQKTQADLAKAEQERRLVKNREEQLQEELKEAQEQGELNTQKRWKVEDELKEAQRQLKQLQEEASQPVVLEPAIVERIPAAVEQELAELRARAAQPHHEALTRYRVHFDVLTASFKALLNTLELIKALDSDTYSKYRNATLGLISKIQATLQ